MRNLSLLRTRQESLSGHVSASTSISAIALDLDENALYVAAERQTPDAEVEIEVWKIGGSSEGDNVEGLQEHLSLITTLHSQAYLATNPWSSPFGAPSELVCFKFLPDTRTLVFVLRGGDIATANVDDDPIVVDVVGNVEAGILATSWSPDDSLLALATGDDKLILMTSSFDVVCESALNASGFGEDAPINVGWGSKQTQFHGSLGKAAAQAPKPAVIGSSPDDDELPRISWRGDGALFAVSSLSPRDPNDPSSSAPEYRRRSVRIYSHTGILQSTSEPTPGLEHSLSWRPSGNWIVSTQRYGFPGGGSGREGRHDVVMFERNGLRRAEFNVESVAGVQDKVDGSSRKWGYRVREIGWSSDSNIMSIWVEKDHGDVVQLWTIGNYHWYLKHEIAAPPGQDGKAGRFTSVYWHPEDASTVFLTTASDVIKRSYIWDTFVSRSKPPHDSGSVVVLDGASILLTPFRTQNVPPPMSSLQLPLTSSPNAPKHQSRLPSHISFTPDKDIMTSLWETGYIELTDLHTRLGPGPGKVMDPVKLWTGYTVENQTNKAYRQILALVSEEPSLLRLAVLGSENKPDGKDVISLVVLKENEVQGRSEVVLPQRNGRLIPSDDLLFWQAPDGEIFAVDFKIGTSSPVAKFPRFYSYAEHAFVPQGNEKPSPSSLFIGLTPNGNLSVCTESEGEAGCHRILATNANSFIVASGFLVYTTTAHVAHFAPLAALSELLSNPDSAVASGSAESLPQWETRRVERGSRIVTAVPSTMSLVLQMPRGNLETINPRPLVMEIVKQDIDKADYAKAFAACRRHRVDLNVFVEHDKETLMGRLAEFVEQVENVDYINLFLTSIGQGTLPDDVVNQVCDRVRQELEKKDMKKYINSILTAHVMKRPADHEAGLDLLLRLRENEPGLVEDAVKYIIFLVDADRLFDTALGMYDFSLVLMVAQHAQKDPREYLPFLRELRALEKSYQRFKIDDHLKRYEKALRNLSLAGEDRFDEALAYVEKYQLYDIALSIWKDTERYDTMLSAYGDWLFERREFKDAAFVFRQASRFSKAMLAYEKALDWQELFDIAFSLRLQDQISEGDLVATAYSVAEGLSGKKRYQEAARVLLDYGKDVREAVISLVQGNHFSEARRIITMHSMLGLLEEIVYPGALESRAQIAEELGEMKEQLKKQVARLRELRVKKVEEPDAFYGVEDMELHNVDVMTDVSMAPTMFTRYTVAPSAASKSSKRSSRSKRKMERKVGSGRKGTVDEEEYLLRSVTKLVTRFNTTQAEAMNLLPHLFQFAEEHREEGRDLQRELEDFARELKESVDEIWKKPQDAEAEGETSAEGWAKRMQEYEKQRQIDPMDKVAKPELVKQEWNTQLSRVGLGMGSRK